MTSEIASDLGRKLQLKLAEVLEREARIASHVLSMTDITLMMIEASVMMIQTTAATVAAHANGQAEVADIFNMTFDSILKLAAGSKEEALRRAQAAIREHAA